MKTVPFSGSGLPAEICAFKNASPKLMPTPITSPVERISGPSTGSTPWNLLNGNTGDLTKTCGTVSEARGLTSSTYTTPYVSKATGVPLTYGTVREARGLTSSTYTTPFWMAYCTFIRPTTDRKSTRLNSSHANISYA